MDIKRVKSGAVKINLQEGNQFKFVSHGTKASAYIDVIQLDDSMFTNYYSAWCGSDEEVFATDDFIKIEFKNNLDILDQVVTLDSIEYVFYLASAGDLKKSTAMYIKKELADTLGVELIKYSTGNIVNRLEGRNVVINKIQAYISFMFSGAYKTNIKPNVVVIEELKYKYCGVHTVIKDLDTLEFEEKEIETELISHDGQGVISLELAERIKQELNSRPNSKKIKNIEWITFRLYTIGGKGMCIAADIKAKLEEVYNKFGDSEGLKKIDDDLYIKDIYSNWHNVKDVDMILNESQTKLIKYFDSIEDIEKSKSNIPNEYSDIINSLYICKYNENKLRTDKTMLNYQFTQALALSYKDMVDLAKDDKTLLEQSLKDVNAMLVVNQLADIKETIDDDIIHNNSFDIALDLVKYDEAFLKDKLVLEQIRKLYISKIKKLAYGKIHIKDMAYRLIVQDPQVYFNFIATRDMETARDNDCLQANEISVVGIPDGQRTVIGRNPLSSHQEMIKFQNRSNNYINSLGYKSNSMIVVNSYDALLHRMSGADCDGDTAAVMVDDTIYDSVIELDTPLFFNTFDGAKVESLYTKENIIEITKLTAGDKIGSLALINAGLMNKCNELPLYDYRINKEISLDDLFKSEKQKVIETWDGEININQQTYSNMNELFKNKTVVNGIFIMNNKQLKNYIKNNHMKYRYEQYLILVAQQCAIDCSKTGMDIPKNIKDKIKLFSEKPSFLRYTGDGRNKGLLFRNSVLDTFAKNTFHEMNNKRLELLKDVSVSVNEDITLNKSYKNTNVIRNQLKIASKDADENRAIKLAAYIKPQLKKYAEVTKKIYVMKKGNQISDDDKIAVLNKAGFELGQFLKTCYKNCKDNLNSYTLDDLNLALYMININSKYIIRYIPELIIHNVMQTAEMKKVFIKGKIDRPDGKLITLGNKEYTLFYEEIKKKDIEDSVLQHSLIDLKRKRMNEGSVIQLKSHAGIKFNIDNEYILKRKIDNRFLWQAIDSDGVIVDDVRLTAGSKEFHSDSDELSVIIESYKGKSKTGKYESWYVERCALSTSFFIYKIYILQVKYICIINNCD